MPVSVALAQFVIAQAQRRASILEIPVAIALADPAAELIGCLRSDGASADLLDRAMHSVQSAARGHFTRSGCRHPLGHGIALLPAWRSEPSAPTSYQAILAVTAEDPHAADAIASGALCDVEAFAERHRHQLSDD
ncbi:MULTISPECIES: hypothetical protein [Rhodococcus]|uniref:Uncharacterized protein n=1 Tax=Rhodococcus wratislaviensis NBRC 100605 TaxID=1219028 RepID=X0Q6Y9_RHOWR|nr:MULTISPECIES: hypothetical protein [Rhodococcus]WAM19095.1 hypothetical protein OYT95_41860 [Rhodococcus sp. JS3073]GAF47162.1 hypothetical protein RW1_038_00830 [Rhodococcus wratislaviensis NBRC 100605]